MQKQRQKRDRGDRSYQSRRTRRANGNPAPGSPFHDPPPPCPRVRVELAAMLWRLHIRAMHEERRFTNEDGTLDERVLGGLPQ